MQAIEGLMHGDAAEPWGGGPVLAKNTMDTRAQREESDEWRDWAQRFTHIRVLGRRAYRSGAPETREAGKSIACDHSLTVSLQFSLSSWA